MDRYLIHGASSVAPASRPEPALSPSHAANMATADKMLEAADSTPPAAVALIPPDDQNSGLAQAVAALLSPTITVVVDRAIAAGITRLRKELGDQAKCLTELEC